jgi:hypothetical protein
MLGLIKLEFRFAEESYWRGFFAGIEKFRNAKEPDLIQMFFVYEHLKEFFDFFGNNYLQKVLDDISYILEKKWGFEISEKDFFHGHICGQSKTVIRDVEELLSPSNICFLYHTLEYTYCIPGTNMLVSEAKNRNILSFPGSEPKIVHPNYEFGKYGFYVVHSSELGFWEHARFYFGTTPNGPYKLRNGTMIDLWGVFP